MGPFLYPFVDVHMDGFHTLAIMNVGSMNMGEQMPLLSDSFIFLGRLAGSCGSADFSFFGCLYAPFHDGYTTLHSHQQHNKVSRFPDLANICLSPLGNSYLYRCEVGSHSSFNLGYAENLSEAEHIFINLLTIFLFSEEKYLPSNLPKFRLDGLPLCCRVVSYL